VALPRGSTIFFSWLLPSYSERVTPFSGSVTEVTLPASS
jgi:hypothetical protein